MINAGTLTSFSQSPQEGIPTLLDAEGPYNLILVDEAAQATEPINDALYAVGPSFGEGVVAEEQCSDLSCIRVCQLWRFSSSLLLLLQSHVEATGALNTSDHPLLWDGKSEPEARRRLNLSGPEGEVTCSLAVW